jgi:hypothetical protein
VQLVVGGRKQLRPESYEVREPMLEMEISLNCSRRTGFRSLPRLRSLQLLQSTEYSTDIRSLGYSVYVVRIREDALYLTSTEYYCAEYGRVPTNLIRGHLPVAHSTMLWMEERYYKSDKSQPANHIFCLPSGSAPHVPYQEVIL